MIPEHYYGVDPKWFARRNATWSLSRDAFAEPYNAVLPDFWSPADDAFKHDWANESLWIHPPYEKPDIVDEAVRRLLRASKAPKRAVMLAPLYSYMPHYKLIARAKHLNLQLAHDLDPFVLAGAPPIWGHKWMPLGFLFCNVPPLER